MSPYEGPSLPLFCSLSSVSTGTRSLGLILPPLLMLPYATVVWQGRRLSGRDRRFVAWLHPCGEARVDSP